LGEVIDAKDPLIMGRCKVKIFDLFDYYPDELLPWAFPANSEVFGGGANKGSGSFHYPKVGSFVRVKFNNGDYYHPEYYAIETLNKKGISVIITSFTNSPKIFLLSDGRTQEEVMREAMEIYNKEFGK
jgi:hypothetical protein